MYSNDALNVDVVPGKTVAFELIPGVTRAVQVFPNDPDMEHMWVIYVESAELENVKTALEADPAIDLVERIPVRMLSQQSIT